MNKTSKMIRWLQNYSSSKPMQITQATAEQAEKLRAEFGQLISIKSDYRTVQENLEKGK